MTDLEHQKKMLHMGRTMFGGAIDFVMGAVNLETLPPMDRPEVCFAGRSNVGKSSLINALTKQKNLARTSNTPGRTQELNYFKLGDACKLPMYLVDLPGYGYAKASKERVRKWTYLVKTYLTGRSSLRRIFLLIDGRHGIKDNDKEIMKMLDVAAVNYQIILTKIDKLKVADRDVMIEKTKTDMVKFIACHPEIITTSSEKGWGIDEVRAAIAEMAM